MGGDDLGADDDYFLEPLVATKADDESSSSSDADDDAPNSAVKRGAADNNDEDAPAAKKRKKQPTNQDVLIQAGCGIESRSVQEQISFLTTSLQHYSMLEGATTSDKLKEDGDNAWKLTPKQIATSTKDSLCEKLRDVVSLKRLKKHREVRSPAVVIVCQSARRAVAILKELNDLRLRATKLFPKNGEVPQQVTQLRQSPFPLAVGTPHRLLALAQATKGLNFQHTQLVVLDTFISKKQYTVCTLPDTAADTMALLRDQVLPELKTNKNLRIAFF